MKHQLSTRLGVLITGLAMVLALGACGSSSTSTSATTSGKTLRNMTVLLDWFPNPDHVALYLAQEKGYFKDAGLNVKLQAPSDPSDPAKLVSAGKVELGISYEPEVFLSKEAGLQVTAVSALIPTALNSVMMTGKSSVKSLDQLGGKKVGDAGLPTDKAFLTSIYSKYGVDAKSVREINLKTSLVQAMISGNVDATIGGYRNIEGVQLEMGGYKPTIIPITDAGVPNYDELVVIANTSKLSSDKAYQSLVRDFLGALVKGQAAAQTDAPAAAASMKGVAKGYSAPLLAKMIAETVPLLKNSRGDGRMDETAWNSFGQWMFKNHLTKTTESASSVMTNDFLPAQ